MFVISQNGEHTVNMDEAEELLTERYDNEIFVRMKSGNRILLAKYTDRKALGRDMTDLLRHYEEGKKIYIFPEGGSDE